MEQIVAIIKEITSLNEQLIELSENNFNALKNTDFETIRDLDIQIAQLESLKSAATNNLINLIKNKAAEYNEPVPRISSLVPHVDNEELLDELLRSTEKMENSIESLTAILLRNIQYAKLVMEYKNEQIEMFLDVAEHESQGRRGHLIIDQEL